MAEVFFNGVAGRLEGRFHRSENPRAPLVLVLHPNPAQGGTMNNRVTYAVFQAFVNMGFSVLRFNFRGVGRSQGEFEDGPGELSDATIALDWLQAQNPDARQCWIAGYSFGAWIGLQLLMRRPDINNFIAVSPPANEKDFSFLEEGDHMYNGHLVDLYKIIGNYVIGALSKKAPAKKRRGRRKKSEIAEQLLLEGQGMDDEAEDDELLDDEDDDDFDDGLVDDEDEFDDDEYGEDEEDEK